METPGTHPTLETSGTHPVEKPKGHQVGGKRPHKRRGGTDSRPFETSTTGTNETGVTGAGMVKADLDKLLRSVFFLHFFIIKYNNMISILEETINRDAVMRAFFGELLLLF
jgi:hypothetical protein